MLIGHQIELFCLSFSTFFVLDKFETLSHQQSLISTETLFKSVERKRKFPFCEYCKLIDKVGWFGWANSLAVFLRFFFCSYPPNFVDFAKLCSQSGRYIRLRLHYRGENDVKIQSAGFKTSSRFLFVLVRLFIWLISWISTGRLIRNKWVWFFSNYVVSKFHKISKVFDHLWNFI